MSRAVLEAGLSTMAFARKSLLALIEDVPAERLVHPPTPNGNHALWILGHLVWTDDFFLSGLSGSASLCSPHFVEQFGMGSTPVYRADAYPPLAELRTRAARHREGLEAYFRSLPDTRLNEALPEKYAFAANYMSLPGVLAWHEGMHTGQLTVVRRSLGLAPKFG